MFSEIQKIEKGIESIPEEIFSAIFEVQKPRSRFQLEKFVLGQHDTAPIQYLQTIIEIQSTYYSLKRSLLELKKIQYKIEDLEKTSSKIDLIDIELLKLDYDQTVIMAVGSYRELKDLIEIFDGFEHKYSREEIEYDQPNYWKERLTRQSILDSVGNQSLSSNLESLRQIGLVEIENITKEISN